MKLNKKPKLYQNFTTLKSMETLKPLKRLKPLTVVKSNSTNIPNEIELLLLSTNLLYQTKRMLDNEYKPRGTHLTIEQYTAKATELTKRALNYKKGYIEKSEFKQIKKDFKLGSLYR